MARKRIRTQDVSSNTLHDFFASKPLSTQFQGKTKPGGLKFSGKTIPNSEVIVIGSESSDSDVEIIGPISSFKKRRKLNPKVSGDHILLDEGIRTDCHKPIHSKNNSIPYLRSEGEHSRGQTISFGRPFLLCPSPKQPLPDQDDQATLRHNNPLFLSSSKPSQAFCFSTMSSDVDIDLTLDDWNDCDEEIALVSMQNNRLDKEVPKDEECHMGAPSHHGSNRTHFVCGDDSRPSEIIEHRQRNWNDAFSLLMTSVKEKEVWKEADVTEDRALRTSGGYAQRKAPFYKILQGMPIAVDAFCYGAIPGVKAYFLSHAHSDHYTNLSSSWKHGPIYCSEGTANLITHILNVDKKWVRVLPMDTPTLIPDTNGVTVTLIEANHCPGSCLFFFEGPQSINAGHSKFTSSFVGSSRIFRYLHCGDFRASPQHVLHSAVRGKAIDHVYLDTTYLDPRYTFPAQPMVISACAELARRVVSGEQVNEASGMVSWLAKGKEKEKFRLLIVVGTYSIGKERMVKAIAHAVNSKIYCDPRKSAILRCQADPELDALLTSDPEDSVVHLVPLATISTDRLKIYLERLKGAYDRVIGFRPTGWTYTQSSGADPSPSIAAILTKTSEQNFSYLDLRSSPKSTSMIQIYPVPYSEHSSFNELTCFAMSFTWVKIIATVNVGSESSRARMAKWFAKWEAERKKRTKDIIVSYRDPHYW